MIDLTTIITLFATLMGVALILGLPGHIAERRKHRNATAIKICGYLGIFGGLPWAVALVWSLTDNTEDKR